MKKSSKFNRALWIAALCAGTGGVLQAQSLVAPPKQQPVAPTAPQREPQKMPSSLGSEPSKVDKASGLLGIEVRNQAAERLGKIRDIVFDLKTGQVAYCVLSVDEGLFSKAKLLAVPLRALQSSPAAMYLTLRADKQRLAQAEGLDPEHWPSITNPAWGAEPFWQENSPTQQPTDESKSLMPKAPDKPEQHQKLDKSEQHQKPEQTPPY